MKASDLVKKYYAAFDAKDMKAARALLRDDFKFAGPMMSAESADQLVEMMKGFDAKFTNQVVRIVESGQDVAALVDCVFTHPFKGTVRMSEWFTVRDGKLASSTLVYDSKQFGKPGAC